MPTQTEAADVSKQLLSEPASASLSELPYPPGLSFGQMPVSADQTQPPSSQPPYLQFDGLVQNYQALATADLNLASLGRPSGSTAASIGMLQPEGLSGTQQAVLAAQQAMATAQFSAPALVPYSLATSSSLPQAAAPSSLPLTMELQQAIAQSSGYAGEAVTTTAEIPLDPNRPVVLQEDDAVSVETQDVNASPGSKKGRSRRSVRSKKRSREGGEQTSRKTPTPITLAVTPVLAAITQAQPIQCLEGDNQDCPGDSHTLVSKQSKQPRPCFCRSNALSVLACAKMTCCNSSSCWAVCAVSSQRRHGPLPHKILLIIDFQSVPKNVFFFRFTVACCCRSRSECSSSFVRCIQSEGPS